MTLLDTSALASDLIDILKACLAPECKYEFLISRGLPPLECNYVALSVGDRSISQFSDCDNGMICDSWIADYELHVYVAIGDIKALIGRNYDFGAENETAVCFNRDVAKIEQCLMCSDYSQVFADFNLDSLRYVSTRRQDHGGGAFVADIKLEIEVSECCP